MRDTALITGASAGIGATYADRLARRGQDLILVARDRDRLELLADRLRRETGRAVTVLAADLTVRADLDRVIERLRDPAITLVVNNAGMGVHGPLLGADLAVLETMVALNVTAVLAVAHAGVATLSARGGGTLINIASILALAPELFNGTYSGTKAFVLNLSMALQTELAGTQVRVQAVLPGATRTDLWAKSGVDVDAMPAERVMDVGDMVDAALAGLDLGEAITIPALPDTAAWDHFQHARLALGPGLSRREPGARYGVMTRAR
jgi:uncharacterized protein